MTVEDLQKMLSAFKPNAEVVKIVHEDDSSFEIQVQPGLRRPCKKVKKAQIGEFMSDFYLVLD